MITINLIITKDNHKKLVENMKKSLSKANIPFVINQPIENHDFIYSLSTFIDTNKYPNKKFIFGPQFSNFDKLSTVNKNNSLYIQPSQPSIDIRKKLGFTHLDMKPFPVGIDMDDFPQGDRSGKPFVYFKGRRQEDVQKVYDFLNKRNIDFIKINYGYYKEEDYKQILSKAPYGIWVGRNESQGIGLQEALSSNVPLLVWNIRKRGDEYPLQKCKEVVKDMYATTTPYWDDRCGMLVYNIDELTNNFDKFLKTSYNPRKFVKDKLSLVGCGQNFYNLYSYMKNYQYDFFLIWSHGLQHLDEIKKIIQDNKDLEIVNESRHDVKSIPKFIDVLYKFDDKNRQHIKNKTKYLLNYDTNVYVYIVKNMSDLESLNKTKWIVRERFNPRFDDPKTHPHPALPAGITHHHVIHGSDFEKETYYIMEYFGITL